MASLYNLELEKTFLSGTIRHPQTRTETSRVQPSDLSTTNRVVLSAIDACLASDTPFSTFLLVDRLNSLGIKIADSIEPGLYIKSLEGLAVGGQAVVGIAKQIKTITVRRKLHETAQRLLKATERDEGKKAGQLIADATEIFNGQVNLLGESGEDEPRDLYGTINTFLDHETSYDTCSVQGPFKLFTDLYGLLDPAECHILCARLKVGKSTFLMSMLHQMVEADTSGEFVGLILDTELTTEEVQSRLISSVSGVKEFYIRHKLYRKNRQMRESVEKARDYLQPLFSRVKHLYIGGWSLDAQLSAARRWVHKEVKVPGKRCLVGLDYFKLTGSEFDAKQGRDIILGKKTDAYKTLAKELKFPLWAMVQANREGEDSKQGARLSNTTVIAGGDMIGQFGSNAFLLERLSPEERASFQFFGPDDPTHSLKALATRVLGPNELGNDCLVRYQRTGANGRPVNVTCENYLLFNVRGFRVREWGTLKQAVERLKTSGIQVQPPPEGSAPLL